jgi:two-component system sensor histidine kinase KdpD
MGQPLTTEGNDMAGSVTANTERTRLSGDARGRLKRPRADVPQLMVREQPPIPNGLTSGALLASLTHELRTPVAALATGSELLLEDLDRLSPDELRRIVQAVHRGAMWLQGLVENVLFAATVAEGAARISPRPVDLAELVHETGPVVEPLLRQRGQRLRIVDRMGGVRVPADSRRIGQVVINLIGNASKYSGPDTIIDVRVARRGSKARLSVADRGPGLPPGAPNSLFGAYARGSSPGTDGIEGAGLGLAIVRSIAELHGGAAGASRRRGGGAQFWVDLPALATASPLPLIAEQGARERLA